MNSSYVFGVCQEFDLDLNRAIIIDSPWLSAAGTIDLNDTDPTTRRPSPDSSEIDAALRADVLRLVESLRPGIKPTPGGRTGTEQRYGNKGSLAVTYAGPDVGRIVDFEADGGMSPLRFIMCERGCGFREAVEWAAQWLGMDVDARRPFTPPPKPKKHAERVPTPARQPVGALDSILHYTVPAEGTPAQAYLAGRGIHSVPPCIGWNATDGAMVCRATDESGVVHAVQLIYLTSDGRKDPRTSNNASAPGGIVKRTRKGRNGWNTVSAMRCPRQPGAADDVVVVAEGPETALSIWQATGLETWAVFGISNVAKSPIPAGKRVVVALDIGAEKHAFRAASVLSARGYRVMVAVPPTYPDAPKTDFNDVLQRDGAEAVSSAIFRTLKAEIQPYYPNNAMPARMASAALGAAVQCYFAEIIAPTPATGINLNSPWHRIGIRAGAGSGKSEAILDQLARPEMVGRYVNYYTPSHRLNADLAARFNSKSQANGGPRAIIIKGREQQADDGRPMCAKADIAQAVAQLGQSVKLRCCHRPATDTTVEEFCEHYQSCPYIAQMQDSAPAVRILAHSYLFQHGLPGHLHADVNVIDESFWQASLRGVDGKVAVPLERITRAPWTGRRERSNADLQADGARLVWLSERLASVLATQNPTPAALRAAGITSEGAAFAKGCWYGEVEDLGITPAMPRSRQEERIRAYRQQECLRLARIWSLVGEEIDLDRDELRSIRVERGAVSSDGHFYDRVAVCWSADLTINDDSHVIVIDADFEPNITRRFVPNISPKLTIEVERQNLTVTQIVDRAVSKTLIVPKGDTATAKAARGNVAKLHALLSREADQARKGALLVTYKDTEDALAKLPPIPGASLAHFNAIRGLDDWRDVSTIIVAGRTQPDPVTLETIARALYFRDPRALTYTGQYGRELRGIRMADGSVVTVAVDHHPDPTVDMLLKQIRESELVQAIDRGRFVYRGADNPARVLILTNTVLPITVDAVTTWEALMPDTLDKLAQSVAVPLSNSELSRCFPDLWRNPDAVKDWRRYHGLNGGNSLYNVLIEISPYFRPCEYRRPGQRGKPTPALVDSRQPDLRAALEYVVGPVAMFEVVADARPAMTDADDRLHPSAWLRRTRDAVVVAKPVAELTVNGRPLARKPAWPAPQRWLGLVIDLNEVAAA